jgi:hypothetical protein
VQVQPLPARVRLQTLTDATPATLRSALSSGRFDVFVLLGSGVLQDRLSKAGGLRQDLQLLPDGEGDDGRLQRNRLGQWLRNAGVRFAVIDGSHSDWVARSLAKQVPAALGFRETVRREARGILIPALWQALLDGQPLDLAVTELRQALDRALPGTGEWCRLIFYLQAGHGGILLPPPQAQAEMPAPTVTPDRQLATLLRLQQLYRQNLDDLQRSVGLPSDQARNPQIDDLRQQVDALARRIQAAAVAGDAAAGQAGVP